MSKGVTVSESDRTGLNSVTTTYLRCACGAKSPPYLEINTLETSNWAQGMVWAKAKSAGWTETYEGRIVRPRCPACTAGDLAASSSS